MTRPVLPSPRASLVVLACLSWAALPGSALAKDTDSNAQGFKAYEKGDTKKAHGLFEKALKQNPKNAYARLNRARTTTLLNQGKEEADDFDYCAYEANWIFRALSDLSMAVEVDRTALLPKIDEDTKGLKALKARPEYAKWRKAVRLLGADAAGVEKVVRETSDWVFEMPGAIPVLLTLDPNQKILESTGTDDKPAGQWTLKDGQIEITPVKGSVTKWKPAAEKYYFNQGQDFFFELQLIPAETGESASGWLSGPLRAGPLLGDCQ